MSIKDRNECSRLAWLHLIQSQLGSGVTLNLVGCNSANRLQYGVVAIRLHFDRFLVVVQEIAAM